MNQIEIPLMMVSGSRDVISPTVLEQIYPFIWAQSSPQKYLVLMSEGTHFTSKPPRDGVEELLPLLADPHRDIGTRYFKALNVAFWGYHLQGNREFLPYLSARYGQLLSEGEPLQLDIVQSLAPDALIASYGGTPPSPIFPKSIAPASPRQETVLAQIERTGVLKVALRQDAAPLGYINDQAQWTGYCRDFARDLQAHLSYELDRDVEIGLVELPSTLDDRFSLVQTQAVHLECGPNTIRQDIEGVTFSLPLLVSGTQFLIKPAQENRINPNTPLANIRIGVLPGTTTEQFIRQAYPQAQLVPFLGPAGRGAAVQAIDSGTIDTFASDGLLLLGELLRQNRAVTDYTLVPERPLTCEFYGLILPDSDLDWKNLVNGFIEDTHRQRLGRQAPESFLADQVDQIDACLNP
jgi:ABC-type amino acid transport substrate-binding protein